MREQIQKILKNMIVSDRYLDREEESIYWRAVDRSSLTIETAEILLIACLEEHDALREKALFDELLIYLEGPLRDGFLDFEEEENCRRWLLSKGPIPSGVHQRLISEVCQAQSAHVASEVIEELISTFRERFNMPQWTDEDRERGAMWAQERWGIEAKHVWTMIDSYLS